MLFMWIEAGRGVKTRKREHVDAIFVFQLQKVSTARSALILTWIAVRCLPLHNYGDPDVITAQAIVESTSSNVKTAFHLKSWRESHLLRPASLILSTLTGKACCDLSHFLGSSSTFPLAARA